MRRHELEHIIRAAADVTNRYEIVVVGSQSLLGSVPNPPLACMVSMEADVFPLGAEHLADVIDGAIGEGSAFHETYGYYAQGVDSTTSTLPSGWMHRLVRVQSENTNGRLGYCLDPTDLFLAKCVANREKDRDFNVELLRARIVTAAGALARVPEMPIDAEGQRRVSSLVQRLAAAAFPAQAPGIAAGLLQPQAATLEKQDPAPRAGHLRPPKPR